MSNKNGYMTVREAVGKKILSERDSLYVIYLLTIMLKKVLNETNGGGHFNVNLDTVWILKEEGKEVRVELENATNGHYACNGRPWFDTDVLNPCFLAPEGFLGRFSPASDVYSLGILLAYMRYGSYPFDINESMDKSKILGIIKENYPDIEIQSRVDMLIRKSIRKNASDRFKDVEELGIAVVQQLDIEMPKCFSCFNKERKCKMTKETSVNSQELELDITIDVKKGTGFEAVAGMVGLKRKLLRDFVDIVSNKELAKKYDILPPNMLFYGPPGTGKTYISQRLAEQCGLSFCAIKPSDLASIWVHGSQQLIRNLFDKATKLARENKRGCLLLIDEFDAVAGKRTEDDHNHQSGEVAELLTQLNDCIEKNVYVIGTTNFLNRIDRAVIRKGRIDEVVFVGMPDTDCRKQLFEFELEKRPHDEEIDIELLSKLTDGYTSSDIAYIVKETARNTFEASLRQKGNNVLKITQEMLEDVIQATRPSVTQDEVRQYEKMRDEYISKKGSERRRIGFIA